jgi:predicted lactoylglutathione lyase
MDGVYGDPDGNEFEIMWMLPAGQIALKPVGSES